MLPYVLAWFTQDLGMPYLWNFCRKKMVIDTSGNHTPGSRSYSDLVDTWADSICIHQLVLRPCSKSASMRYSCRRI